MPDSNEKQTVLNDLILIEQTGATLNPGSCKKAQYFQTGVPLVSEYLFLLFSAHLDSSPPITCLFHEFVAISLETRPT